MSSGYVHCHACGNTQLFGNGECERCENVVHFRKPASIQKSIAFLLTALILYFPANFLPVMNMIQLGKDTPSTILGGVVLLIEHGSYGIAGIIFFASVFVPMAKMLILSYLCFEAKRPGKQNRQQLISLFRITEAVGRWSMIDVFVVAVLVGMIQLGGLMEVEAGSGALAFAGVVVATMLSAMSLDPRLIWDSVNKRNDTESNSVS